MAEHDAFVHRAPFPGIVDFIKPLSLADFRRGVARRMHVLQLVYVSSARPGLPPGEPEAILNVARANNARDAITGFLYSDGGRFLQALEGPEAKVLATIERIRADPRHRAIVVLSNRQIAEREFGEWAMAHYAPGADVDAFIARIGELTANASASVRATFAGFAEVRRAA